MKKLQFIIFLSLSLYFTQVCFGAWIIGPINSQECIQKYQKNAETRIASKLIHKACDDKFNKKINRKYSNCILEHAGKTKSELAVKAISIACTNLYIKGKDKKYSKCILKNMPGVEVDISARSIASSCK